jgi:ABC-type Co2+ transport system permease subunit
MLSAIHVVMQDTIPLVDGSTSRRCGTLAIMVVGAFAFVLKGVVASP